MSIDFILPDIGEGIVECELVEWLVNEGDTIVEDQPVADVMTDKALVQIPAMHSGVVDKLYYQKGDIAKVHQPLFAMTPSDGTGSATVEQSQTSETVTSQAEAAPVATAAQSSGTMVEDFILPDIGEGIVECEVVEWLVAEGDKIEEDQPIADVMTDKALVQIPAMHAGTVVKLYYNKGDIAKVHAPLFALERAGTAPSAMTSTAAASEGKAEVAKQTQTAPASQTAPAQKKVLNEKAVASPAVRRVARELNVNIHQVPGSGKKGRVYKEDVLAFTNAETAPAAQPSAAPVAQAGGTRVEPIRGVKAAMAKAMVNSVSTIPHFTYCEEIDMTNLIKLRGELKEVYAKQDIKLTMMPFFMKSMSLALKQFPVVNSQPNEDCTELTYFDDHNIGMAVDSKVGLLVPNVKQVQTKSIIDLAMDISRLTDAARSGRVSTEDLKGGTITISNIGAIGGTVATPIINKPEAAIVALGKLQTLPRFNDKGEVEARSIMQVSWSGDHRIIDGGTIARFSNLWKSFLEEPSNMLVHMA
ncbi:dihydrolipoamide acetyltransferase component of pyruvate dehydrogenase complex [Thalassotalea insulae]|uniref:Dihydrolipoamide acetyltransferase component of pyruvate dehydrogenase complex n=1 Tax=Thalassotalea insulae TaxID=2056778 RepID=A0ABQ6GVY4_9GAMM|nr:dihydrolipoyllysine-residue acetyltransferase [Thalassotalea insulae]GLX80022.1 dihydrolipoamide acetyltransferase component of pyruvate dehydrogenase complex [Thalassotalea insulae]